MADNRLDRLASQLVKLSKDELDEVIKLRQAKQKETSKQRHGREIARLKARKQKLESEIGELTKRISLLESGGEIAGPARDKGNVSGRPMEALVLEVLRERNQPSRPCDVRDTILNKGWYQGKKPSLTASVSILLAKLVKDGKVTAENKLYSAV